MSGNYYRKLSGSIYHHTKNVGIIGILAYPKSAYHFWFVYNVYTVYPGSPPPKKNILLHAKAKQKLIIIDFIHKQSLDIILLKLDFQ